MINHKDLIAGDKYLLNSHIKNKQLVATFKYTETTNSFDRAVFIDEIGITWYIPFIEDVHAIRLTSLEATLW
jgi:hypothetical protein